MKQQLWKVNKIQSNKLIYCYGGKTGQWTVILHIILKNKITTCLEIWKQIRWQRWLLFLLKQLLLSVPKTQVFLDASKTVFKIQSGQIRHTGLSRSIRKKIRKTLFLLEKQFTGDSPFGSALLYTVVFSCCSWVSMLCKRTFTVLRFADISFSWLRIFNCTSAAWHCPVLIATSASKKRYCWSEADWWKNLSLQTLSLCSRMNRYTNI